jgi:hypothetical protein
MFLFIGEDVKRCIGNTSLLNLVRSPGLDGTMLTFVGSS